MVTAAEFLRTLLQNGVRFFTGVPDSLLAAFCTEVTNGSRHVIAANEGCAVALAAGHYLAGGGLGCVYLQNSGLGNAINPLTSLVAQEVYSIPMLLIVGWRGELSGEVQLQDEPQHTKQGRITLPLLDCLDIPWRVIGPATPDVPGVVTNLIRLAATEQRPVALVVRRGVFDTEIPKLQSGQMPRREDAIAAVISAIPRSAIVVSTTGKASRELYELRVATGEDPARDFLAVGGMGHALQIAAGIAMARENARVVCLDGDGALIMHMGGLATSSAAGNLLHVVFNNGAHESVGGQPTRALSMDLPALALACGYRRAQMITELPELIYAVKEAWTGAGSHFIEVRVALYSRPGLKRPARSPIDSKKIFMGAIGLV